MKHTKITKSLRFKLITNADNRRIQQSVDNLNTSDFNLSNFLSLLDDFIGNLMEFMYYEPKKDEGVVINGKFLLKTDWVKKYARNEYALLKQKKRNTGQRQQYTIGDYGVADMINETIESVDKIYANLCDNDSAELNERAKRSATSLLMKSLYAKKALPCLADLVENVVDKKETEQQSLHLKSLARKLMVMLEKGMQVYLPEQSQGVVLARATLNYYTLNKRPIDFNRRKEELLGKMKTSLDIWRELDCLGISKNVVKEDILKRCEGKELCLGDAPFMEEGTYLSLRQTLKNIMAKQKADFSQMVQKGASYAELKKSDLYLFRNISKDEFDEYQELTDEIEELATEKNQTNNVDREKRLQSELVKLKKQRGAALNEADKRTKSQFKVYKNFAAWYRKVAQRHGRVLAQLKSIEREQVESQMLQYWALMAEDKGKHYLVLVPKEKAQECNSYLKTAKGGGLGVKLYWFESFTYRSLQKLCFGNLENGSNAFYKGLSNDRGMRKYIELDQRGYPQFISGEHEFKGDEQKKIVFYQNVLRSNYAQGWLKLPKAELKNEVLDVAFETLDDFKIALENVCYQRFVCVEDNLIDEWKRKYGVQVFEITSMDLQHAENVAEKDLVYEHQDKRHTTLWKYFWSSENEKQNFEVRLNPELNITYRKPKDSRVHKYGVGNALYDANKKNRYLYEQYTLVTTVSEYCNAPEKKQSFTTVEEVKDNIMSFNENFKKEKIGFAFGLDNGEVELSTLGVYLPDYDKPTNEERMVALKNVEKYGFKALTIVDLKYKEEDVNGKEKRLLQNPSYFLNKELYCRTFGKNEEAYEEMFAKVFEQKTLLSLDLSTAKVIGGHLVTNGDVMSLYNLWMRHAQRNVYEMNEHTKKEGAKRIVLKKGVELNGLERRKFVEWINEESKEWAKLSEGKKQEYVEWLYRCWENNEPIGNGEFKKVYDGQRIRGNYLYNVVMAVAFMGETLESVSAIFNIRNVFKLRQDFDAVKSESEILEEINCYNVRTISDEEVDLKYNHMKASLVANVVGVIDHLYRQYKERFGCEGIIAMENFNVNKVDGDRKKFSGNIYRMLERKLYQKLQNHGLVPSVKNLLQIREGEQQGKEKKKKNSSGLDQIGNVCFVDEAGTSQNCPICNEGKLCHGTVCPNNCGFDSKGIMHSNDGIAGFNIAKKGWIKLKG